MAIDPQKIDLEKHPTSAIIGLSSRDEQGFEPWQVKS